MMISQQIYWRSSLMDTFPSKTFVIDGIDGQIWQG